MGFGRQSYHRNCSQGHLTVHEVPGLVTTATPPWRAHPATVSLALDSSFLSLLLVKPLTSVGSSPALLLPVSPHCSLISLAFFPAR